MNTSVKTYEKNDGVELLRYVCAVGIIWFHMGGPHAWVGHAALFVFIILSVNFSLAQREVTWGRTRVLKLWVFWSIIYGLLKVAQLFVLGQPISSEFQWWMLVTGPIIPLWFLPFIYIANGAASYYNQKVSKHTNWFEALALPCMALGCIGLLSKSPGIPFNEWLLGAAGVFTAISVYRGREEPRYLVAVFVLLSCSLLLGGGNEVKALLLALPISAFALIYAPIWRSKFASQLGAVSLGLYILHHGVSAALKSTVYEFSIVGSIVLVVLLSTVLVVIMKRMPIFGKFI